MANSKNIPNVSVVIPMRNAERYIVQTLNTILSEKTVGIEVVIVDDQSTDGSIECVQSLNDNRIRIVNGTGQGISAALNTGMTAANGEVIMRCDADDLYTPGRISQQYLWLSQHPEYGTVCGGFSTIDSNARFIAKMNTGDAETDITEELAASITRTHFCTFALRADLFKALGGFRSYFVTAEDIDFQLRLSGITKVMYLPQAYYLYRLHNNSVTHTQGEIKRKFFEDTARFFQHQRRDGEEDDLQKGRPPMQPEQSEDCASKADEQVQDMLIGSAWQEHAAGHKIKSLILAWRSFKHSPLTFRYYSSVAALILKPAKNRD